MNYFTMLFSAGDVVNMETCLQYVNSGVFVEMNEELMKAFSRVEVSTTLQQMGPLKASGPKEFTANFFQKNWRLMEDEVCNVVIDILNSGVMPAALNLTHIVLIPKIKNMLSVTEFRPISLCNVLYKLVSKV